MKPSFLLVAVCLGTVSAGLVQAIGLDEISQQSGLGEPLRLVVPVIAADEGGGDDLAGECFKVVPAATNDAPQLNSARLTLERRGGQTFVVVTTAYPIEEPVMRLAVQAGCRMSITREYTVLFDPVAIEPPAIQVAAAAAPGREASELAAEARAEAVLPARAPPSPKTRPVQPSHAPKKRIASAPRPEPTTGSSATVQTRAATRAPTVAPAARASNAPRLQISRAIGDGATPPAATTPKAAAEREALMAIEEQTVVLQRQIAELSLAMERVQEELSAARAARAEAERVARAAPERVAAAAPWSMLLAWAQENWRLLVLLPTLTILVAALLVRRRREGPTIPPPLTASQAEAFNPADLGEPSIPGADTVRDEEAVAVSIKETYRRHMRRPTLAGSGQSGEPKSTQQDYDPEITFDDEVQKTAAESSVLSVLEREEPQIIAGLVNGWGTPRVTAQLENYLLTPRRSGRPLSRGAVEELKLLRSIAMEHITDPNRMQS